MDAQDYEGLATESGELFEMFKFGKYKVSSEMMSTWGKKAADVIDDTIDNVETLITQAGEESSEDDSYSINSDPSASGAEEENESENTGYNSADDYYDSSSQSF